MGFAENGFGMGTLKNQRTFPIVSSDEQDPLTVLWGSRPVDLPDLLSGSPYGTWCHLGLSVSRCVLRLTAVGSAHGAGASLRERGA